MNVVDKIMNPIALLWREVLAFGAVGGLGWFIDNGIYTLLWHGPMSESTIKARVVSTVAATLFAWFANRYWAFRHRRSERVWKEFMLFLVMNGLALGTIFRFLAYRYFVFNKELISIAGNCAAGENVVGEIAVKPLDNRELISAGSRS